MDGDGHVAKVFSWTDEEDDGTLAPVFDPAAVLRAIEAEDDDAAMAAAEPVTEVAPDLNAAVRAALAFEDECDEGDDEPADAGEIALAPDHDAADSAIGEPALSDMDGRWAEDEDTADAMWDVDDREVAEDTQAATADAAEANPSPEYVDEDIEHDFDAAPAADDRAVVEDETLEDWDGPAAPAMHAHFPTIDELDVPGRKPRIALMGEFSAGKSTLSNLLIGAAPLPMKVTATQLPPVWISWGDGQPYREDIYGQTHPVDIERLSGIDPSETRVIRIFEKSEILEACDIIDMPGISDPNMDPDVWERVIGRADGVIWCTHATQAWRQTEASVWESLDPKLFQTSILLVTRFDKLLTESDRARVIRRVEKETEGLFAARLPISLTRALAAGDDPELLERSGAAAFGKRLFDILDRVARSIGTSAGAARTRETLAREGQVVPLGSARRDAETGGGRVLPRRVRPISHTAPATD